MHFMLVMFVALLLPSLSNAADIYVAQRSLGSGTGSDCANAHSAMWFNTSNNWGPGITQIGPGTTVHLCGVITTALAAQGSGSVGSPITLKWETNAKISLPFCSSLGCLSVQSYFVVDGGTNGVIEANANGSPPNFPNQQQGHGLVTGGTDLEVKNLTIRNIYVKNVFADKGVGNSNALFVSQAPMNNLSIHDNIFHDAPWTIAITPSTSTSNWSIFNNNIYNTDHGIALAGILVVTNSNINIYNNHIHDFANMDAPGCPWHHDGIHAYGPDPGGATYENMSIYNNTFDGNFGDCLTAYIFEESTTHTPKEVIFNNVFTLTNQPAGGTGLIAVGPSSGDIAIYNNTFQCAAQNSGPQAVYLNVLGTYKAKNNLIANCSPLMNIGGSFSVNGLNNNIYTTTTSNIWKVKSGFFDTLTNWQAQTGQDASAQYTSESARLNSKFVPQASSIAIGAGSNLTGLGIAALNFDKAGLARSSSGPWDAGAFSYIRSGPPPGPPVGLKVQ
jgi:hypothetical protein